jgi:hypothetical protein
MGGGSDNQRQGDFGESWLEAVAASCGMVHGRPDSVDLDKCDVQLTLRGEYYGVQSPTVRIQVKTVKEMRKTRNGDFVYNDLDIETYNVLRHTNQGVPRALVVFEVGENGGRVELAQNGTLLVGQGAWASLVGLPATTNKSSQTVILPAANTIDAAGLELLLKTCGVRRSTPVPNVDPWRTQ